MNTTPSQPNHNVTPTHIEPEQYNTWNKSTISRKLLKMDVLTFEKCWAVNSKKIKQVTSSWSTLIQPFSERFLILRIIHRYTVILCTGIYVKYMSFTSHINQLYLYQRIFQKSSNINFRENPSSGSRNVVPCRHDVASSRFSQCCKGA